MHDRTPGRGDEDRRDFLHWLERRHPDLPSGTRDRILGFGALIALENRRLGLISPVDLNRLFTRHLQECLAPELLDEIPASVRILDVGSGAGLPGIPIAVTREDVEVVLLEPKQKRAGFLDRAILHLGLRNARTIPTTLEDAARAGVETPFGAVVSRGIRWTPPMVSAVRGMVLPDAPLLRFGAPGDLDGIRVLSIESAHPRAIQIWPPHAWDRLDSAP